LLSFNLSPEAEARRKKREVTREKIIFVVSRLLVLLAGLVQNISLLY